MMKGRLAAWRKVFEAGFVSAAHDDAVIEATIAAARKVFVRIA